MTWNVRRALAPGFAALAVLAGVMVAVPVASAGDPVISAPREMRDLVRMPKADLEALYLASPSLDECVDEWIAHPPSEFDVDVTLYKYFARMTGRPVPPPIRAGCTPAPPPSW